MQERAPKSVTRSLKNEIFLSRSDNHLNSRFCVGFANLNMVTARHTCIDTQQAIKAYYIQTDIIVIRTHYDRGGMTFSDKLNEIALANPQPFHAANR
jgi:hypothetical protein